MWFLLLILLLPLLLLYLYKLNENYYVLSLCGRIKTIDGSDLNDKVYLVPGRTVFGNNFDLLQMNPEKIFTYVRDKAKESQGKPYNLNFLLACTYNITTAEDAEQIFQSPTIITKGYVYELLKMFLGEGLLISTDKKWHFRRKILTPAFHFNVLQNFNEIFKEESFKLLNKLQNSESLEIDVGEVIKKFALNNVCETAMGVKLDNITGGNEYRKIIHDIETLIVHRICNPLMYFKVVFYLFGDYKKHRNDIKIAHNFSSKIIEKKRKEYLANCQGAPNETKNNEFGLKKRYAMLDTLLDTEARGLIDHQGICDEVNTFMFEGYDTTSMCLILTILNLSVHADVQQKCREEIKDLSDLNTMTVFDFNKLEYLECVLKETLRMYPSVPFIGRFCTAETKVNGLILPKNTQCNIHIFDIMRDPRHFPEPDVFKPERFLSEASSKLHPFAFVPFSAGSRNCIGQKFAMLEMKTVLTVLLKNFEILPITRLEDITFCNGLVLRTKDKIFVKLKKISE